MASTSAEVMSAGFGAGDESLAAALGEGGIAGGGEPRSQAASAKATSRAGAGPRFMCIIVPGETAAGNATLRERE
jgi:hypothetical protein